MTARQVFEATLIELSKVQAPSLRLYEFNYLFNKAINQYINKVYNIYDINQQTTDDLRVLKATAYLTPNKYSTGNKALQNNSAANASSYLTSANHSSIQSLHGATYEVFMPMDYLHILNCVCVYYVAKQKDCWDAGSYIQVPATRLTADSWSQILTDIYNRPSPMKPYYYINNVNTSTSLPTNAYNSTTNTGTDISGKYEVTSETDNVGSNFNRTFKLGNNPNESLVEKSTAVRVGNTSNVRCEIRYGKKLNKNRDFC